jgi:NAD(P) transhydrogenase alpha subunit
MESHKHGASTLKMATSVGSEATVGVDASTLVVGVPCETRDGEKRVAASPDTVALFRKEGFKVYIQSGAGADAQWSDEAYAAVGAEIRSREEALGADIVLKVSPPSDEEVELLKPKAVLISFLYPSQRPELVKRLQTRGVSALAMDCMPRTLSRAQTFDALSSMANLAGYRAVVEAAHAFGRFFAGQFTAAGRIPPAKILVIGAGVAGLAAIQQARNMGAVVRAFDVRASVKEQITSVGAEFLEVEMEEDGEGSGGYAKEMSPEFIAAEMRLFAQQCKEVRPPRPRRRRALRHRRQFATACASRCCPCAAFA